MPTHPVTKATAILNEFSVTEPQLGVSELARRLGLNKSTVHNLLAALRQDGLVEQDPASRRYRLGRRIAGLGYTVIYSDPLLSIALPYLHYVAQQVDEAAYLAERRGHEAAPVLQARSPSVQEQLGWYRTIPLHSTSAGKVLLAHTEERELQAVLDEGLARYTEYTITDPAELRRELQRVREQGFATCFEEAKPGLNGIAVPVRNLDGQVVAALAVAGPAYRMTRAKALGSLEWLRVISTEITLKLGEDLRGAYSR